MGEQLTLFQKVKVFALFLVWTAMGLCLEIPGPTMIDIKLIYGASYEEVSRSVSGRGAGGLVGALMGGILVDKFDSHLDLLIALAQSLASVAVSTIPYSYGIEFVWLHYFILGACGAIINIAGIRSVILIAGKKTSATLQLLHTGYGLGSLLVPVMVNPFLAVVRYVQDGKHAKNDPAGDDFTVLEVSKVHYAFVIIGAISSVLALVFYCYHCKRGGNVGYKLVSTDELQDVTPTSRSVKRMLNPGTYADGSFGFGLYMFIVLFLFYFNMAGAEEAMGNFVRSFSVDVFKFNKTEASYLNMTFWLSLTIARLVMSVVSNYVAIKKLFKVQVLFNLFASTLFLLYASNSAIMLWLCTILLGFSISPLYPSGIAYGNTQMDMTGVCIMVISVSGAFGDMTYIWGTGKVYDTFGPKSILILLELSGVVLLICILLFKLVERSSQERETKTMPKNPFKQICKSCT